MGVLAVALKVALIFFSDACVLAVLAAMLTIVLVFCVATVMLASAVLMLLAPVPTFADSRAGVC